MPLSRLGPLPDVALPALPTVGVMFAHEPIETSQTERLWRPVSSVSTSFSSKRWPACQRLTHVLHAEQVQDLKELLLGVRLTRPTLGPSSSACRGARKRCSSLPSTGLKTRTSKLPRSARMS